MAAHPDPTALARLSLHDPSHFHVQLSQTKHRLDLLERWNIREGSRVLELGCGQGDCTTVLADAVGEEGKVVALDPADLEYGSPYTLRQAQGHITQGPLGPRITWIQQDPITFLTNLPPTVKSFDIAILAHSLWYFPSPSHILQTFQELKKHTSKLLLAEWALEISHPSAQPHLLASLAQASLECRKLTSISNIRTILSPVRLKELAREAGWRLETESLVTPDKALADGRWEVDACLSSSFTDQIQTCITDERERGVVLALRDACEASLGALQRDGEKKRVRAMDVWVGSFA